MSDFHSALPATGYVRLNALVGAQKKSAPPIIPVSKATLWRMVKDGRFPSPIKLSANITVWDVADIRAWMNAQAPRVESRQ